MAFLDSLYIDPTKFRHWVRNVGASYADLAVGGAVFFFLTPLIVRHLGAESYGLWLLCHTITFYLGFLDLGIGSAAVRFCARFSTQRRSNPLDPLIGTVFVTLLLAGIVAAGIAGGIAALPRVPWVELPAELHSQLRAVLAILALNLLITFPTAALSNVYFGLQRFDLAYGRSIVLRLIAATLQTVALIRGHGVVMLAVIEFGASVARAAIDAVMVNALVPGILRRGFRFHRPTWMRIRRFALWASIDDLLASGTQQLDRVFIAIFLPLGLLAPYAISKSVAGIVSLVIEPMTETFYPMASELQASGKTDALQKLLLAGTKTTTALALPLAIFLAFFGADAAVLWVPEIADDVSPLLITLIVLNLLVSVFLWTSGIVLMALNRVRSVALMTVAEVALGFLLIWIATRHLGIIGIATGAFAANVLVGALVQVPLVCRTVALGVGTFLAPTLLRLIAAMLPACATAAVLDAWLEPQGWTQLIVSAAAILVVYLPSYMIVGLTPAERARYRSIVQDYWAPAAAARSEASPR